jgi:hypothetical protein
MDCSEAGQFTNPVDKQPVAVYVSVVCVVVVVSACLGTNELIPAKNPPLELVAALPDEVAAAPFPEEVAAALPTTVELPPTAHTFARVVYQRGTWVCGVGPHVWVSKATVAPAFAPTSSVYSSTTRSSQSLPVLPVPPGLVVTLVTNCATSAQMPAVRPALKLKSPMLSGVPNSTPTFAPTRRTAVSTISGLEIVTGRNSKLPPVLAEGDN